GLDARAFAGIKVAAVGEQTARALVAFGVKPDAAGFRLGPHRRVLLPEKGPTLPTSYCALGVAWRPDEPEAR
ncbi:hypothetical protein ACWDE9_46960, partial [Streptomyces olivaceoviridis]